MPDNAIYRGTLQPLRQRYNQTWSPTKGFTGSEEWLGFGEEQMLALAAQYLEAGVEYDYTNDLGVHTLRATNTNASGSNPDGSSQNSATIDTWEIAATDSSVSSLMNPLNISDCATGELEVIARAIKDGTTIADAAAALKLDKPAGTYPTTLGAYAARLYYRMQIEQGQFFDSQYVLRHTTTVGNRWNSNVSDYYVNSIYTTAQLLSEAQSGSLWVYPLPGRLAYKINALASDAISRYGTNANYQWGWLKSASSEASAANNRVNIVTEYKFSQWSTDEYLTV